MKKVILFFVVSSFIVSSCRNNVIGKYNKEELPQGFHYNVVRDKSDSKLKKNELYVVINQKITLEQIASLAEQLFYTKSKKDNFYIFYYLNTYVNPSKPWAKSHFNSKLEIEIIN